MSSGNLFVALGPTRLAETANWPFAYVVLVDDGLWVDSYQALIKLE